MVKVEEEWAIEADLSSANIPLKSMSDKNQTASADKKLLPQLPKKIELKSPSQSTSIQDGQSLAKNKEKKFEQEQQVEKKEEQANKIYKRDLINRLKREQKRLSKVEQKKKNQDTLKKEKIQKILNKRKSEISHTSSGKGSKPHKNHPYLLVLKKQVSRAYTLPDIYLKNDNQQPIFLLKIAPNGTILELKIYKTSHNSALDAIALKALKNAAPFPQPPKEFWGQAFKFVFNPNSM